MSIKTSDELIQQALNYITAWRPDVDTSVGTLIKDIVIDVPATVLGTVYQDLQQIQKASSVNYVNELTDNQVEDLAANYNLTRKQGSYATGIITFIRYSAPTTTITVGASDGTGGVSVSTLKDDNGVSYSFTTVETKQFTIANADSLYNASRNRWELNITIQADQVGSDFNVAANAIKMFSGINGIDDIINYNACVGGLDIETNEQLGERIIDAAKARLLGTIPGYETLVNSFEQIVDSTVVDTSMSGYIRNTYGNEVDIVIIGQQVEAYTDTINNFNPLTDEQYVLNNQPVISVNSITGIFNGEQYTFEEGTDYLFVKDTTSDYMESAKALDKIVWQNGGNKPDNGTSYTINYSANQLISTIQATLDNKENHLVGSDVLVREGEVIYIKMELDVLTYSGINPVSSETQIKNVIQEYVNNLKLGEKIEQSDIVYEIRSQLNDIVDNISLPFTILDKKDIISPQSKNILTCSQYQYFRIDIEDIKININ